MVKWCAVLPGLVPAAMLAATVVLVLRPVPMVPAPPPGHGLDPLRASGQFHRLAGEVVAADAALAPDLVESPPLLLLSAAEFAGCVAAGRAAHDRLRVVAVASVAPGRGRFSLPAVSPGSYALFCLWPGLQPTRLDAVLLEDDYPRDDLRLTAGPARTLPVIDDLLPAAAHVQARYAGWWPDQAIVARENGVLLLAERAPDGLPVALSVRTGDGAESELPLCLDAVHAGITGPFLLSHLAGVAAAPGARGRPQVAAHGLAPLAPPGAAAGAGLVSYRVQSPRRGAGVYFLFADGGASHCWSDCFGDAECVGPPGDAVLAVVEPDRDGVALVAPVRAGAAWTDVPRHPTYVARGDVEHLVCIALQSGGRALAGARVRLSAPDRVVASGSADDDGLVLLRGVRSPMVLALTVTPAGDHAVEHVTMLDLGQRQQWRLGAQDRVMASFHSVTLPPARLELQLPERVGAHRLSLVQRQGEHEALLGFWWLPAERRRIDVDHVPAGDCVCRLEPGAPELGAWSAAVSAGTDGSWAVGEWHHQATISPPVPASNDKE